MFSERIVNGARRSPHGERGLKFLAQPVKFFYFGSLSSWRAWIEILMPYRFAANVLSLSSWRAWIEMFHTCVFVVMILCRSPHGERGLKSFFSADRQARLASLSSWRAWIEISPYPYGSTPTHGRSPHGERGLKYHLGR